MKLKQTWSRRLASLLSAVMILSTITPATVPVLAAAPDEVKVDSLTEQILAETGLEELLAEEDAITDIFVEEEGSAGSEETLGNLTDSGILSEELLSETSDDILPEGDSETAKVEFNVTGDFADGIKNVVYQVSENGVWTDWKKVNVVNKNTDFNVALNSNVRIKFEFDSDMPYLFIKDVKKEGSSESVDPINIGGAVVYDLGKITAGTEYVIDTTVYEFGVHNLSVGLVSGNNNTFELKPKEGTDKYYDTVVTWVNIAQESDPVSYIREDAGGKYVIDHHKDVIDNITDRRVLLNRAVEENEEVYIHIVPNEVFNEEGTKVNGLNKDNVSANYIDKNGNTVTIPVYAPGTNPDEDNWWERNASMSSFYFDRDDIQKYFEDRHDANTKLTVEFEQIQYTPDRYFIFSEYNKGQITKGFEIGKTEEIEYHSEGYDNLDVRVSPGVVSQMTDVTASIDKDSKKITVSVGNALVGYNEGVHIDVIDKDNGDRVVGVIYVQRKIPAVCNAKPTVEVYDTTNKYIVLKVGIENYEDVKKNLPEGTYFYYWAEITATNGVGSDVLVDQRHLWNSQYWNENGGDGGYWPLDMHKNGMDKNAGTEGITYDIKVWLALYDQPMDAIRNGRPNLGVSNTKAAAVSSPTKAKRFEFEDNYAGKLSVEMPVGTTRQFSFYKDPSYKNLSITRESNNDITAEIKGDAVSVTAGVKSKGQNNKLYIHDNDSGKDLGFIEVTTETSTVSSAVINVDAKDMTHNSISLKLNIDSELKYIEGLYCKIYAKSSSVSSDVLVDEKTVYVPITEAVSGIYDLDLRKEGADIYSGTAGKEYDVTASLIQFWGDDPDAAEVLVTESKSVTVKSGKTKDAANEIYETKLKIAKAKTPAKIYNNMTEKTPVKIGVTYSNATTVKKLERVELLDADGNVIDWWSATRPGSMEEGHSAKFMKVNTNDSGVDTEIIFFPNKNRYSSTVYIIGKGALLAGKYSVKAYAYEPLGSEVTAKIDLTVLNGIVSGYSTTNPEYSNPDYRLSVSPADNTYIYKKDNKPATLQMTAYVGSKKTNSVVWSVNSVNSELASAVTIKSGKLTIDKGFKGSGELTVTVKANDWAGNESSVSRRVYVYKAESVSGNITLKNNTRGFAVEKDKSYYVNDLFGSAEQYGYGYVAQFTAHDNKSSWIPIKSFSAGGAVKLIKYDAAAATAYIAFIKPGKATLKGTADDGSGRTFNISFMIKGGDLEPKGLTPGTEAFKYSLTGLTRNGKTGNIVSTNKGSEPGGGVNYNAPGQPMLLEVSSLYNNTESGTDNTTTTYIDSKPGKSVGASVKAVKNHPGQYTVTPTKERSTVIIKYGAKFDKEMKIEFRNSAFSSGKLKVTPENMVNGKVQKGKIYNNIDFSADSRGKFKKYGDLDPKTHKPNTVTFTLDTEADVNAVMIEVTNNAKLDTEVVRDIIKRKRINSGTEFFIYTLSNNKFTLDFIDEETHKLNIKKGSYQLVMTAGNWNSYGEIFTAASKSVKVKINAAPAAKSTVKKTVNLNFADGGAALVAAADLEKIVPKNYIGDVKYGVNKKGKEVSLRNVNSGGKMNYFSYNFLVSSNKIFFSGGHNKSIDPSVKADKPELSGYIPYTYQQLDGRAVTTYIKGTVKLNSKKILGTR